MTKPWPRGYPSRPDLCGLRPVRLRSSQLPCLLNGLKEQRGPLCTAKGDRSDDKASLEARSYRNGHTAQALLCLLLRPSDFSRNAGYLIPKTIHTRHSTRYSTDYQSIDSGGKQKTEKLEPSILNLSLTALVA